MPRSVGKKNRLKDLPLLLNALFWVCWVRLGLSFSSLEKIREVLLPEVLSSSNHDLDLNRMAWSVRRISRFIPMATCLTRAQALQIMLARKGLPTELILGVSRSASKDFLAHAWIEKDGQILIGGSKRKIDSYSKLKTYGATSA